MLWSLAAVIDDHARAGEAHEPAGDQQREQERQDQPADREDVQPVKQPDGTGADDQREHILQQAQNDQADGPFPDGERRGEQIDQVLVPELLQQVDRDLVVGPPDDLPEDHAGEDDQRQVRDVGPAVSTQRLVRPQTTRSITGQ